MSFKVGDYVKIIHNDYYTITRGDQTGYIQTIVSDQRHVTINFDKEVYKELKRVAGPAMSPEKWLINTNFLKLVKKNTNPKENPIHKRMRDLWNKSNWVKANPTRAY